MRKILWAIVLLLSCYHAPLLAYDIESAIRDILITTGMPKKIAFSNETVIEQVSSGNNSQVYRMIINDGSSSHVSYLRFSHKEGSRSGFYIKPQIFLNDISCRRHGEKRRQYCRKIIHGVNSLIPREEGSEIFPLPLSLNYHYSGKNPATNPPPKHFIFEYRLNTTLNGKKLPSDLQNCIISRWSAICGIHITMKKQSLISVFDPINYSPSIIKKMIKALTEYQYTAKKWIEQDIAQKAQKSALPKNEIQKKIEAKLTHESRSFTPFNTLYHSLLRTFNLPNKPINHLIQDLQNPKSSCFIQLKKNTQEKKTELTKYINEIIYALGGEELSGDLINAQELFFSKYYRFSQRALPHPLRTSALLIHPVNKIVFLAERDQMWESKGVLLGKKICRAIETQEIINDILYNQAKRLISLFKKLASFQNIFIQIEQLPKGLVLQTPHPYSFIRNRSGSYSILTTDNISWDTIYVDLSTMFLQKILRDLLQKNVEEKEALKLIQATIDGYNQSAPIPIPKEHLALLCDIFIVNHLGFVSQTSYYYSLNDNDLDKINLTVTYQSLLKTLRVLERYKKYYLKNIINKIQLPAKTPRKSQILLD